eukprot:Cvel_19493.t1-p1 / transcript=Cvel_19493.t1 / gene=Cvel_19493 / organism=Chromera_velia_CCMP2878 / gene_product=hypothetical protein / transcript_product=hypothetical protein / location=Cvel_scaffold1685:298-26479(-) / protein_length=2731 / sequence_SO=supercontig / SO=protein_coding / is_pseudo=false
MGLSWVQDSRRRRHGARGGGGTLLLRRTQPTLPLSANNRVLVDGDLGTPADPDCPPEVTVPDPDPIRTCAAPGTKVNDLDLGTVNFDGTSLVCKNSAGMMLTLDPSNPTGPGLVKVEGKLVAGPRDDMLRTPETIMCMATRECDGVELTASDKYTVDFISLKPVFIAIPDELPPPGVPLTPPPFCFNSDDLIDGNKFRVTFDPDLEVNKKSRLACSGDNQSFKSADDGREIERADYEIDDSSVQLTFTSLCTATSRDTATSGGECTTVFQWTTILRDIGIPELTVPGEQEFSTCDPTVKAIDVLFSTKVSAKCVGSLNDGHIDGDGCFNDNRPRCFVHFQDPVATANAAMANSENPGSVLSQPNTATSGDAVHFAGGKFPIGETTVRCQAGGPCRSGEGVQDFKVKVVESNDCSPPGCLLPEIMVPHDNPVTLHTCIPVGEKESKEFEMVKFVDGDEMLDSCTNSAGVELFNPLNTLRDLDGKRLVSGTLMAQDPQWTTPDTIMCMATKVCGGTDITVTEKFTIQLISKKPSFESVLMDFRIEKLCFDDDNEFTIDYLDEVNNDLTKILRSEPGTTLDCDTLEPSTGPAVVYTPTGGQGDLNNRSVKEATFPVPASAVTRTYVSSCTATSIVGGCTTDFVFTTVLMDKGKPKVTVPNTVDPFTTCDPTTRAIDVVFPTPVSARCVGTIAAEPDIDGDSCFAEPEEPVACTIKSATNAANINAGVANNDFGAGTVLTGVGTSVPLAGGKFPVGKTTVECVATGDCGSDTVTFSIEVVRDLPPSITIEDHMSMDVPDGGLISKVICDKETGDVVTLTAPNDYSVSAQRADGDVECTITPLAASQADPPQANVAMEGPFLVGDITTVMCMASNECGPVQKKFSLELTDPSKTITNFPGDLYFEVCQDDNLPLMWTFDPPIGNVEACSQTGSHVITCDNMADTCSAGKFDKGKTTVTCDSVSDICNGMTSASFHVQVKDITPALTNVRPRVFYANTCKQSETTITFGPVECPENICTPDNTVECTVDSDNRVGLRQSSLTNDKSAIKLRLSSDSQDQGSVNVYCSASREYIPPGGTLARNCEVTEKLTFVLRNREPFISGLTTEPAGPFKVCDPMEKVFVPLDFNLEVAYGTIHDVIVSCEDKNDASNIFGPNGGFFMLPEGETKKYFTVKCTAISEVDTECKESKETTFRLELDEDCECVAPEIRESLDSSSPFAACGPTVKLFLGDVIDTTTIDDDERVTCTPPLSETVGQHFSVGTTQVTCVASSKREGCHRSFTKVVDITVVDVKPFILGPADFTTTACFTSLTQAKRIDFDPDIDSPNGKLRCPHPANLNNGDYVSADLKPGTTMITCTANPMDENINCPADPYKLSVTVGETGFPKLMTPGDLHRETCDMTVDSLEVIFPTTVKFNGCMSGITGNALPTFDCVAGPPTCVVDSVTDLMDATGNVVTGILDVGASVPLTGAVFPIDTKTIVKCTLPSVCSGDPSEDTMETFVVTTKRKYFPALTVPSSDVLAEVCQDPGSIASLMSAYDVSADVPDHDVKCTVFPESASKNMPAGADVKGGTTKAVVGQPTTIMCMATNDCGTTTEKFSVTPVSNKPMSPAVPSNLFFEVCAAQMDTVDKNFAQPIVADECTADPPVLNADFSGGSFPIGMTSVTCTNDSPFRTAKDACGSGQSESCLSATLMKNVRCCRDGESGTQCPPMNECTSVLLTFEAAEAYCEDFVDSNSNDDYRLCTDDEIGLCCGGGCSLDSFELWTSTPCKCEPSSDDFSVKVVDVTPTIVGVRPGDYTRFVCDTHDLLFTFGPATCPACDAAVDCTVDFSRDVRLGQTQIQVENGDPYRLKTELESKDDITGEVRVLCTAKRDFTDPYGNQKECPVKAEITVSLVNVEPRLSFSITNKAATICEAGEGALIPFDVSVVMPNAQSDFSLHCSETSGAPGVISVDKSGAVVTLPAGVMTQDFTFRCEAISRDNPSCKNGKEVEDVTLTLDTSCTCLPPDFHPTSPIELLTCRNKAVAIPTGQFPMGTGGMGQNDYSVQCVPASDFEYTKGTYDLLCIATSAYPGCDRTTTKTLEVNVMDKAPIAQVKEHTVRVTTCDAEGVEDYVGFSSNFLLGMDTEVVDCTSTDPDARLVDKNGGQFKARQQRYRVTCEVRVTGPFTDGQECTRHLNFNVERIPVTPEILNIPNNIREQFCGDGGRKITWPLGPISATRGATPVCVLSDPGGRPLGNDPECADLLTCAELLRKDQPYDIECSASNTATNGVCAAVTQTFSVRIDDDAPSVSSVYPVTELFCGGEDFVHVTWPFGPITGSSTFPNNAGGSVSVSCNLPKTDATGGTFQKPQTSVTKEVICTVTDNSEPTCTTDVSFPVTLLNKEIHLSANPATEKVCGLHETTTADYGITAVTADGMVIDRWGGAIKCTPAQWEDIDRSSTGTPNVECIATQDGCTAKESFSISLVDKQPVVTVPQVVEKTVCGGDTTTVDWDVSCDTCDVSFCVYAGTNPVEFATSGVDEFEVAERGATLTTNIVCGGFRTVDTEQCDAELQDFSIRITNRGVNIGALSNAIHKDVCGENVPTFVDFGLICTLAGDTARLSSTNAPVQIPMPNGDLTNSLVPCADVAVCKDSSGNVVGTAAGAFLTAADTGHNGLTLFCTMKDTESDCETTKIITVKLTDISDDTSLCPLDCITPEFEPTPMSLGNVPQCFDGAPRVPYTYTKPALLAPYDGEEPTCVPA